MVRKASCCCGDTYITVAGEPLVYAVCHCDNCKRRTGSAFGMNVYFDDAQIVERSGNTVTYEILDEQQRHFCSSCGTTLYWKSAFQPEATGIAAGCFTENPLPQPGLTVANESMCDWLTLPNTWKTSLS